MLVYQKTIFDPYHCRVILQLKTLEKYLEKLSLYHYEYNGAQKHEGFVGFENVCSREKTYVILTSLKYIHFYACKC